MSAAAAVEATTSASQAIVRPSVLTRCPPVSVLGRADRFNCDDGLKSLEDGTWLGVGVPERESESERAVWGSPRSSGADRSLSQPPGGPRAVSGGLGGDRGVARAPRGNKALPVGAGV